MQTQCALLPLATHIPASARGKPFVTPGMIIESVRVTGLLATTGEVLETEKSDDEEDENGRGGDDGDEDQARDEDEDEREGPDTAITGEELERASAEALEIVGEGRVTDTEVGDEEGAYEVEVTLENGSQVDVHLDEDFNVISEEAEGQQDDD